MNNYQNNARSMNGLNNINANALNSNEIDVDFLVVNTSGTCPTRPNGDSTLNIANTAFVDNAISNIGSNYVTLTGPSQTITSEKIFTESVEIGPATLTTVDINTSGLLDVQDVYVHGLLNIGNATITESGIGDVELNNPTNDGKYIFKVDDIGGVSRQALNLSSSTATFYGDINTPSLTASYISNTGSIDTPSVTSGLQTDDLNIGQNQTSGDLFLGCRTDRTGTINIGTLATGNAPIVVGSTSSTTQTATHNAITTFTKNPFCSLAPATGDHLTNRTYTDGTFVGLTGNQTIGGNKTFSNTLVVNSINTNGAANNMNLGQNLTTGDINLASSLSTACDLNWGSVSNGGGLNFNGGANYIQRCGAANFMEIATTQNSGTLEIGTLGARTGNILINTGTTSTGAVNISSGTNANAPITIGSTASTTQTCAMNATTTFTKIPQCAINSIGDNNDLVNYGTLNQRFTDERPYFNPVGTIITYAGSSAPTGYLLCDGTLYSQFTYPSLFSVIFNTYGGSFPNFRVPNTQGIFISSTGTQTLNSVSYTRTLGTRQNDTVEDHKHTYSDMMWWDTDTGGGSGQTIYVAGADFQTPGGDTVGSNGDGNFSNRLTKATYPSTAVNPGTPIQQWNAPTNVSAITATETFPANIAFGHYIKF